MATQSRPFMNKGVALASAAAIAAATPAIMPTLDVPTHALATAEVQLATFADVMSVPAGVWSDVLFSNQLWGYQLSGGTYGPAWAAPQTVFLQPGYVNPWAGFCDNSCAKGGITGVAYLFLDALINGNGLGYDNSEQWSIGFVNYLLEPIAAFAIGGGSAPFIEITNPGLSAATWYALQGTIGQAFPELTVPIAALYWGPNNLSVAYNLVLSVVALGLSAVPVIGPFLGNSVLAYLGDLQIPGTVQPDELYYQFGLSGTLNYWIDIATGAAPFPTGTVPPQASPDAAAAVTSVAAATSTAADSATSAIETSAVEASEVEATEVEASGAETSEVEAPKAGDTTAVETSSTESTSADTDASTENSSTESVSEVTADEATVATTSVVDSPSDVVAATTADAAPTATGPAEASTKVGKRSARGAAARVATKVASAIDAAKAGVAKAGAARSANGR
jgi:hypothetical protein